MTKRKLTKWNTKLFVNKVFELEGDQYTPLESYDKMSTKTLIRHEKCGHTYRVRTSSFLMDGNRCPFCNGNSSERHNTRWFKSKVKELEADNYTVLGEYVSNDKVIRIRHNECGNEYLVRPARFVYFHSRCPKCNGYKSKQHDDDWWKQKVKDLGNAEYKTLEKYINLDTPILIEHNCGYVYPIRPNNFISLGQRCNVCVRSSIFSKGEKFVYEYFNNKNIEVKMPYIFEDLKDKNNLHFDCYIPSLNMLIEYQGRQHYSVQTFGHNITREKAEEKFKVQLYHDKLKSEYAKDNGYLFLAIPYTCDTKEKVFNYINKFLK